MGTITIAGWVLTSVIGVERVFDRVNAELEIPGTASVVQAMGRKRDRYKITGILAPASEVTAVYEISVYDNHTPIYAYGFSQGGMDWSLGSGFFIDKVTPTTQPGTSGAQNPSGMDTSSFPWGKYTIELLECS